MSDTICCLLPIILLVLLPLPIIGARRWWSMRGLKSRFEGDGERIKLGALSGPGLADRAQGIALLIKRITGAQAPPLDPGLG